MASFTIHGIGVSGGIAIGHAHLVSNASLEVGHYVVPPYQLAEESARFDAAVRSVRAELEELHSSVPATAPAEFAAFINLHLMILNDSTLSVAPRTIIEDEQCNAEWALKVQMDALLAQFDGIDDAYLRERRTDVIQVVQRLLKALSGQPGYIPPPADADHRPILVAHDLSPADVVQFKQHQFASFITDVGGTTSHTAVVARSLNIPSIVALHRARQLIRENELLIVDGTQGVVIVAPEPQILAEYELRQHQFDIERQKLKRLRHTPATTLDGIPVELHANIELPGDVVEARENGATGIGLFRSEFLFLNRSDLPDEDEQFEAYRNAAQAMDGMPVTIRTYDLGADKQTTDDTQRIITNPALGLRAIRLCLTEPQRFLIQLRAMLRASHYGKINILIPMLVNVNETNQALQLIARAKSSLDEAGIPYDREIKVGGMIEVPAAALALEIFTRRLDFLSIGTNDLIQYTLAVDRTDDTVAHLYDPLHPAVLALLANILKTAGRAGVPVALCGEMAGDVSLTRLLLGLGLRQFSMHSAHLLDVKQRILKSNIETIRPLALKMLRTSEPDKLLALLDRINA
ncbi:MAG: phosphoenolpyruvate--protein phosphotransferase [Burkholderiales bacterium]